MEDIIYQIVTQNQREDEDISTSCYIFYNIHLLVQIKAILQFRNLRLAQAVCNSIADCGGVGWLRSARRYELRAGTTIRRSRYGSVAYVKHCRATQRTIRQPTCQYTHRYNVYLSGYPRSTGKRRYRSVKKCIGTSLDQTYEF